MKLIAGLVLMLALVGCAGDSGAPPPDATTESVPAAPDTVAADSL